MDKNQDKINKIYNYKLYKLPIEIIYEIMHKFDNIQDLINFYDVFDKYKKYIILSIENINNYNVNSIRRIIEKDDFYKDINNGYIMGLDDIKENYYLIFIKYKYKKHIIYKKIIKIILKCHKCKYDFNLDDIKHIYICIYCSNYFCESCCVCCRFCKIYDGIREYSSYNRHCFDCYSNHCFFNISMDLKRIKNKDDKKIEDIKKRLIKTYLNNIADEDINYKNKDYFIDILNISDDLKNILKIYSNEL